MKIELRILLDGAWVVADGWVDRPEDLLERYLSDAHLRCCAMQGGFFIDIDGKPWSDDGTVDEFWMTLGFLRAVDAIVHGVPAIDCAPGPWEESHLTLARDGDLLVMQDIHHSGAISMPRVAVDFRTFVLTLAPEAQKLCDLLAGITACADALAIAGDPRPQLPVVRHNAAPDAQLAAGIQTWAKRVVGWR